MKRNPIRSVKVPIILASVSVTLAVALLVGWTGLIIKNIELTQATLGNSWLLAGGAASFAVIMAVLIMFAVFLVREIGESVRQNRFIDSVTHELRSPLASVKLGVQTLERRNLTPAQRQKIHSMMMDDVQRLQLFIDDILQASRIGYGPADQPLSEVGVAELAERSGAWAATRHKCPPQVIDYEIDPSLSLWTDRTALETVLRNLLDNAIKYSDPPPKVTVRAALVANNRIRIEVEDQGIGIPRKLQKRIFDRFYRVPMQSVNQRRGTGLGLHVAASHVKNLGGRLEAASAGPGTGTTMRFSLPLPSRPASAGPAPTPRETHGRLAH